MKNTASEMSAWPRGRAMALVLVGALTTGFAPAATADWYFGAKAGPMLIDTANVGNPTNVGVMIGKEWGVVIGDVGVPPAPPRASMPATM